MASDDTSASWPRLRWVTFPQFDGMSPGINEVFARPGIPAGMLGGEYAAAGELSVMEIPGREPLVRFGETKSGDICVDPNSGEVFEVTGKFRTRACMANASICQFVQSVQVVIKAFPFYSMESDLDERIVVASKLTEAIRRVDSSAIYPDSFWSTFIDDVEIGDYATEEVLEDM